MNLSTQFDTMDLPALFSQHSSNMIDTIKGQVERVVRDEIRNVLEALCDEKSLVHEEVAVWFATKYGYPMKIELKEKVRLSKVDQNVEIKDDTIAPTTLSSNGESSSSSSKPRAKKAVSTTTSGLSENAGEPVAIKKTRAKKKVSVPAVEENATSDEIVKKQVVKEVDATEQDSSSCAETKPEPPVVAKKKPRAKKATTNENDTTVPQTPPVVKKSRVSKKATTTEEVPLEKPTENTTPTEEPVVIKKTTRAKKGATASTTLPSTLTTTPITPEDLLVENTCPKQEISHSAAYTKFGDHGESHTRFQVAVQETIENDGVEMCRSYYPQ
jgi:hypothetical protein